MMSGRSGRRAVAGLLALWLFVSAPVTAQQGLAEEMAGPPTAVILTLDQERLFTESAFGKASLERERAAARALEAENSRIEAELVEEEQDLTVRRSTLPASEFAALAEAFDEKVERIRTEQDAKARELTRVREMDRQVFLRAVVPALGDLLGEFGAAAILDKSMVILSLSALDITDEAIARVDAVLGEGNLPPETP